MASGEKRAASAVGARTARACDSCIRRRARWYCTADDAFLCQGCDTSVHSANLLASRHQRVRLKAASTSAALVEESLPAWFCRKARTPRHSAKSTKLAAEPAPALLVPDIASDDHSHEDVDDQLLCRVPIFDPYVADFCSPSSASGQEFFADDHESKPLALVDGYDASDDLPSILPDDVDLADFVADVDELFGGGLHDVAFGMEGLVEDDVEACFGKRGTRFKMEDDEAEDLAKCPLDRELNFRRDMFDINFDSGKSSTMDKEEEEKMPVGAITVAKAEKRKVLSLRLDWKAVIAAWASQGLPWTTGNRPQVNLDDLWPDIMGGCGSEVQPYEVMRSMAAQAAMGDGGREARVSRYREKRRTRLFSKKIRYEVRKLNAEKRPRMKGRFVKRVSIAAQQGFAF